MQQEVPPRSPYAPAKEEEYVGWCCHCGQPIKRGEKHLTMADSSAILWKDEMTANLVLHYCNKPPFFCVQTMLVKWPQGGTAAAVERQKAYQASGLIADLLDVDESGVVKNV